MTDPRGAVVSEIEVADLARVVYSSGKVFDGLRTGRVDTENFLRSGSLAGVTSRGDLALLEDLRDVAEFVIDHRGRSIDGEFVKSLHAQITRSGAMRPGVLRTAEEGIGVKTRYGRHEPDALSDADLDSLVREALVHSEDPRETAMELFVRLAKAQPFQDGNKRTALFVANALLLSGDTGVLLVIPVDDEDVSVADAFNDKLARAYVLDEEDGVKDMLREHGFVTRPSRRRRESSR